jgi:hypothetical protein
MSSDGAHAYDELVRLRGEGLIWRRAGDELIALDLDSSQYFAANETATAVWDALADGATREELVTMLCARFEVEQHVAEADIGRLLSSLQTEGLIETWSRPEQP